MIVYNRLWETMKERKISQYLLINYYQFSSGQISRLKKNMNVSTHTINVLCNILNCTVNDIMEFQEDEHPLAYPISIAMSKKQLEKQEKEPWMRAETAVASEAAGDSGEKEYHP